MRSRTGHEPESAAKHRADRANVRTGLDADAIATALIDNLHYLLAKRPQHATRNDWYMALAYTVRDRLLDRYIATVDEIAESNNSVKVVAYLSAEFLTGPHLGNNLVNLGIWDATEEAVSRVGQDLSELLEQEEEPGLGNGGLGRLAACYMDSLATLNVPAIGYGIRYEFGIFDQAIRDGWQVELTDKWLRFGNPWEIVRSEITFDVDVWRPHRALPRRPRSATGSAGFPTGWSRASPTTRRCRATGCRRQHPAPVEGGSHRVLRLRRLQCRRLLRRGGRESPYRKPSRRCSIRTTSREIGKQLRLAQQYFFVSCSLQDMIRLHLMRGKPLDEFHAVLGRAAQRHASLDCRRRADAPAGGRAPHGLGSGLGDHAADLRLHEPHAAVRSAREVAARRCSAALLPRHLEIIYEINRRFLDEVRTRYPGRRSARAPSVAHRRSGRAATCAWRISPASAATPSTAWRRCTPSCSSRRCSATSTESRRKSSSTSPTA